LEDADDTIDKLEQSLHRCRIDADKVNDKLKEAE
jgi:hypothetical protein